MRNSARMQGDRSRFDPAARSEITAHVKQYLIRFDIIVDPRNFHCFRMGIEQAWRERANNVTANLKRLMDGRWLMDGAGNWLEVLGVERERVNVAIPPNNIERMMRHRYARPARSILHQDLDIFFLVDRIQFRRSVKIALRIRRPHFDLTFAVQIAFRNSDRASRF